MHPFLTQKKPAFEKTVEFLTQELAGVRTGRANTALVEGIDVDAYGSMQSLKNVASISTPDAQTIQIQPWDQTLVKAVEKALLESDIGMTPNTAGTVIRLAVPPMTEETRKEMVKVVGKRVEEARISVRKMRDDVRKEVEKQEKEKTVSEDERYQLHEELDEMVTEINETLEKLGREKEAQIMNV